MINCRYSAPAYPLNPTWLVAGQPDTPERRGSNLNILTIFQNTK